MPYKVVLADNDWPSLDLERKLFEKYGIIFTAYKKIDKEELIKLAGEIDALIVEYTRVDEEVIKNLTRCKIISINAIGFDRVDIAAATQYGICVANVPDYCIEEVAAHTVSLIVSCARKVVHLDRKVREGRWSFKDAIPINRFQGKVLGLISFGKIGRRVSSIMQAFGFRVIAYDPYLPMEVFLEEKVKRASTLQELLENADIVSIHCPLTSETINLIDEEQFRIMKPGAILINASRGGIVNEKALYEALIKGRIAGAGLDVMVNEPPDSGNPLFNLDNIVITPHVAFYSEEAMEEVRVKAANEVVRVLIENKLPVNLLNKDVIPKFVFKKESHDDIC
ncbi:MAG: C-terminal binding protein [Candidatus Odinarchaeia archaeon]